MTSSAAPGQRVGQSVTSAAAVRERAWTLAIWAAAVTWAVLLSVVVHGSYTGFRLGRFDLGNMVQAVWSTTQGRILETTDGTTGEQITRLGGHVDPFLVLLAPLWALWPSPLSIAFAQIVAVSFGALPVFWLARRRVGSERIAALLGLAYLVYPWLAWSAIGAIHPVTFAIPLYLFCVWFLEANRLVLFAVCAGLAMSTGELMGLPIAGLGLWYAIAEGRRWTGSAIATAGGAWTALAVFVVVPAFRGESSVFYGFYDEVGGSPQGVLRMLASDPSAVLGALVESHDIVYVIWLGLPLCGLFVLAPGLALVGIPQLVANTLSDFRSMSDPRYHAIAAVYPFLVAATVLGIARLAPRRRERAVVSVLVVSSLLALALGPWLRIVDVVPLGAREPLPSSRVEALRDAVALVPDSVPVAASNVAGAHLSGRRYVFTVPRLGNAEWALVDRADPFVTSESSPILTQRPEAVDSLIRRLERDVRWSKVFERDGVLVFRRTNA